MLEVKAENEESNKPWRHLEKGGRCAQAWRDKTFLHQFSLRDPQNWTRCSCTPFIKPDKKKWGRKDWYPSSRLLTNKIKGACGGCHSFYGKHLGVFPPLFLTFAFVFTFCFVFVLWIVMPLSHQKLISLWTQSTEKGKGTERWERDGEMEREQAVDRPDTFRICWVIFFALWRRCTALEINTRERRGDIRERKGCLPFWISPKRRKRRQGREKKKGLKLINTMRCSQKSNAQLPTWDNQQADWRSSAWDNTRLFVGSNKNKSGAIGRYM